MGLFSDFRDTFVDPFGLVSSLTGQTGADAALQAGRIQSNAALAGIDEQRRQFDMWQENMLPFLTAGTDMLPTVQGASTAGGLDERLREIMGGEAFQALQAERERSVGNQLSQSGLMRSGAGLRAAAAIPTDLALALEEQLFGRQSGLVDRGQNAASGLGVAGQRSTDAITRLLGEQGAARAGGVIGSAQAQAAGLQNLINTGMMAAMFFSDPRLKRNMKAIGRIGPLTLYEWDWIPAVAGMVGMAMTTGFDAAEVRQHFPQHVVEATAGFLAIDYPALTDELKEVIRAA